MPVRVLVVDDSAFFRRRLTEILNSDEHINVIGVAADGKEAIEQVAALNPDVITMDIEMPVMDGITAVKKIMQSRPTPILMFSSLTTAGAKSTLDALEAGAMDFLPKRMEDISADRELAKRQLCARVRLIGARGLKPASPVAKPIQPQMKAAAPVAPAPSQPVAKRKGHYRVVVIGTSTGGPVALQEVLTKLPGNFPLPILLVQHMPGTFTPAFAERLNKLCAISVKEAADGDQLKPGVAYLAPGGKQMLLEGKGGLSIIRIIDSDASQTYKPSVDITFGSVTKLFAADVLAVVLTGMGADGREGARMLKRNGATVWAQDEASCVIYGMPAAIAEAGLADKVVALKDVGPNLVDAV
jgi:two-component system chemotaxis response regulator CheB